MPPHPSFRKARNSSAPVTSIGRLRTKVSGVSTRRWFTMTSPSPRTIRTRPLGRYPSLALTASDATLSMNAEEVNSTAPRMVEREGADGPSHPGTDPSSLKGSTQPGTSFAGPRDGEVRRMKSLGSDKLAANLHGEEQVELLGPETGPDAGVIADHVGR